MSAPMNFLVIMNRYTVHNAKIHLADEKDLLIYKIPQMRVEDGVILSGISYEELKIVGLENRLRVKKNKIDGVILDTFYRFIHADFRKDLHAGQVIGYAASEICTIVLACCKLAIPYEFLYENLEEDAWYNEQGWRAHWRKVVQKLQDAAGAKTLIAKKEDSR